MLTMVQQSMLLSKPSVKGMVMLLQSMALPVRLTVTFVAPVEVRVTVPLSVPTAVGAYCT